MRQLEITIITHNDQRVTFITQRKLHQDVRVSPTAGELINGLASGKVNLGEVLGGEVYSIGANSVIRRLPVTHTLNQNSINHCIND